MERPADTTVYRLVHRTLAGGAERLAGAVDRAGPEDRGGRLDALVRWTTAFATELRWHQAEEDAFAFPALVERVPAAAAIVDRLGTDHRDLTRLLADLSPALAAMAAPAPLFDVAQRRASAIAGQLRDLVAAHVFDEDVNIAPLIERHLSHDEFTAQQMAAARRLPLRDAAFTVPWLLAGCSPAEREQLIALLPRRLQVAGVVGGHRYRRLERAAFGDAPAHR